MNERIDLVQVQRDFFRILDEFFRRATGKHYSKFASPTGFAEQVRANADRIGPRGYEAYRWAGDALAAFYNGPGRELFGAARQTAGMKLVLGGSTRFNPTQFDSVRKMLLYADTILVPDPILPWIELERSEERFRHVLLLQNAFVLLHLQPLVEADLPYPAVVVFPSWEKSLETRDQVTQAGIEALRLAFFSHYLGRPFSSESEIADFVRANEAEFLTTIERQRLFVPPGGAEDLSLPEAVSKYLAEIATWRTSEHYSSVQNLSLGFQVLLLIYERLIPQYHLLENADELHAQPMLSIPAQWHYYTLCARMYEERLASQALLSPQTVETLRSLNEPSLQWLGNVPVEALVELRRNNENEDFRRQLDGYIRELYRAPIDDLDRTAAEVSRGIAGMLGAHQRRVREIEEKYALLHKKTAVGAWATLAATLIPALAPWIGEAGAPLVLAGAYAWTKVEETHERRIAARSLTGVLAAAKQGPN